MSTETSQFPTNAAVYMVDQHIAATRGDRLALRYGDKKYSYHDLAALMNRAGNMFRSLSVGRGEKVLLLLSPSPAFVAALLGAMKIGAVPVILPGDADGTTVQAALKESQARLVVVREDALDLLPGQEAAGQIVVVGQATHGHASFLELIRSAPSSLAGVAIAGDETALAFMEGRTLRSISHRELHEFLTSPQGDGPLKSWDVAQTLAAFAQCDEAALAA